MHFKHQTPNFDKMDNNKDTVVSRPDRGSGTVILNRDQYIKSIFDIISVTSKFKKLAADPTLIREKQLQRFLRKLKKNEFYKRTL